MNMIVIINERLRCGAYSDSSVVVLGIAAPRPMPVSSRSTAIDVGDCVNAVAIVNTPKRKTDVISTHLRPMRSEAGPAASAPITRPIGAALITRPNAGREIAPVVNDRGRDEAHDGHVHAVGRYDEKTQRHQ